MAPEQRFIRAVDDPGDVRIGKTSPKCRQDGQCVNNVAQCAWLEEANALCLVVSQWNKLGQVATPFTTSHLISLNPTSKREN